MPKKLIQDEADRLISISKRFEDEPTPLKFPEQGGKDIHTLLPTAGDDLDRHTFLLDIYRGGISLTKLSFNSRVDNSIVLMRLDMEGRHRNPDGQFVGFPHVHRYREGYGDKFATEVDISNAADGIEWFLREINTQLPTIATDLFSG